MSEYADIHIEGIHLSFSNGRWHAWAELDVPFIPLKSNAVAWVALEELRTHLVEDLHIEWPLEPPTVVH